ncbi:MULTISPECIES: GNAT family N-acetyltransferase [unclassified Pseudomonas]|uniref:GNAT family N-acetyltransferase n=1 Tax=unclassified Pseudomonas TaxID=196821 RepID=UPI002360163F|nr:MULTISPECIES: N-acetyltransferase [unclassified Pseudomonas]
MNVRQATTGDQPALFDIHRSVFRCHIEKLWGWNEAWQRQNFSSECENADTSVVEEDGVIAGYTQVLDEDDQVYIQNIALSEAFQGRGIGTELLRQLQSHASARKVPLMLSVFRTNPSARRLYERLGFLRIGESETHIEMCWAAPCGLKG